MRARASPDTNMDKFNRSLVHAASLKPQFGGLQVCLALFDEVKNVEEILAYVTSKPTSSSEEIPVHIFVNPHMVSGECDCSNITV